MTEIEKTEGEIKVLQAKLELLKEVENHKSPAEEAYKGVYGWYPPTTPSVSNYEDNRWSAFQNGYNASKEECKVEEPIPEPETLYELLEGWVDYGNFAKSKDVIVNEILNVVKSWLPYELEHDEDLNGYRAGWNDCLDTVRGGLR